MKPITIDPEKCNRDGICVKACPAAVIELASPNELPAPVTDFKEYCLACGHCVAVCPTLAAQTRLDKFRGDLVQRVKQIGVGSKPL